MDEEIRDIKENMVQLTASAQSAPLGLGQTPGVHYGQEGDEKSVFDRMEEIEG